MITNPQPSTFKVFRSDPNNIYNNIYKYIEKDKIESAFVEFVKENRELGKDRYFNVKYTTVNHTDIFEFTRASTQPSIPLGFGIFLNNDQYYDPNNPELFQISIANAKIIKDHQDKIQDGIILCPQGDDTITFHKDLIKAGLEDYVKEHGMPSHNLKISTVRDRKPIFTATKESVSEESRFIVKLPNGSTLGEGSTFKELENLTIGDATYRELQNVIRLSTKSTEATIDSTYKESTNSIIESTNSIIESTNLITESTNLITESTNSTEESAKLRGASNVSIEIELNNTETIKGLPVSIESMKASIESMKESIESMKIITIAANKSLINSFFNHLDDNPSDNEAIKELLTTPSDHKDEYIAHFLNLAKSHIAEGNDLSKIKEILEISDDNKEIGISLKDEIDNFFKKLEHKVDKLELELDEELKKSEDAIDALELELEHEEDIKTISSFFATSAPNTESSDQTSISENVAKIKELLTRVSSTADFNNPINKKLKEHLFSSVESATKQNPSKVNEVLGILDNLKIDDSTYYTSINFAILKEKIIKIKVGAEETTQKEAEEKAKKETEERAKREAEETAKREDEETAKREDEDLIKQEIQKAKNEKLLLSRVRLYILRILHIKEYYPQLPISIDQTSSPSLESKNAFKTLLESKGASIEKDYACKRIGKAEIYENNETKDFFVVLVLKGIKGKDGKTFVFDKNDILDDDLKAHIEKKDKEIEENLSLIDDYFKKPNDESLKTKVSVLLKKEFEIMRYSTSFKSIYGNKFKDKQGELEVEENANKTEASALYDDCKFDLMNQYFKNTSSIFLSKRVSRLLKNNDDEYLNKFKELLNKTPEDSDAYKKASSLLKKSQNELLDTFFKGSSPKKITIIKQEISADPELMEYFRKKFHTCSDTIESLKTLYTDTCKTEAEKKKIILAKIKEYNSIKSSAKKILTSAENIAAIDAFFKAPHQGEVPEETKTNIEKNILTDPELMQYFKDKLDTCNGKLSTIITSHQSKTDQESTEQIRNLLKIKTPAQEILTSAQKKIAKTTKLVDDVFNSISPSGTEAPETLAEGAEEEKNVHAIEVFLSQLKSAIDKGKSEADKTQADQNIEKIKDAFSSSLTGDTDQASKKFKIEFFNSLVDTLNNDKFTKNNSFLNFQDEEPMQEKLFESFSQVFNGETIGALTALGDSIKTTNDRLLVIAIYNTKMSSNTQSRDAGIIQTTNLVYDAIIDSLSLASKKLPEPSASTPASTPAPAAASASAEAQEGPSPASVPPL